MPHHHTPLLIVGSGPAGYTAAIYGARALLKPILVSGVQEGGQLTITTDVENYPGFADVDPRPLADGADAAPGRPCRHDASFPTRSSTADLRQATLSVPPAISATATPADALVIATGAQAKWLGLPSEERFKGFGVSACATCDGFFSQGQGGRVVGGATPPSRRRSILPNIAAKVTLVHRRDAFRAERILQERLFSRAEFRGDLRPSSSTRSAEPPSLSPVTGVTLRHARDGVRRTRLKARRRVHRHRACAGGQSSSRISFA